MNKRPYPMVAHGLAAMLAKARNIETAKVPVSSFAADLQAQKDAQELVQRAQEAESKLLRVAQVIVKLQEQCAQQPEDSLAKIIAESIIGAIEKELVK